MCGISGIYSANGVTEDLIRYSIQSISHRGPDDQSFFFEPYCHLGMCRLAIIDVISGNQPNFNRSKDFVSIFNGEIYNYRELHLLLKSRGYQIDSSGDAGLIPHLYEEFGDNFVQEIEGMFAIAILNRQTRELILARDRLGEKPLWYCANQDRLLFSSELKGLLSLGVKRSIDLSILPEYLQFGYVNAPRSPYLGVEQLEPASILKFNSGYMYKRKYWNPENVHPRDVTFEDAKEEAMQLIEKAVKERMISERPIGSFLSGGIDSTIVTSVMAKNSESSINSYSIGFKDSRFDESIFANRIAEHLGTDHHTRIIEPDPSFIVSEMSKTLDMPFADSSIIPTFLLSKFAREGVVVALSGDGGDEVFGGYQRYIATQVLDLINPLLYLLPIGKLPLDRINATRIRKLVKNLRPDKIQTRYRKMQSLFSDNDLRHLLNPDLVSELHIRRFDDLWASLDFADTIRKLQEFDLRTYLPGDLLYKVDIASMSHGLEVRSPFLDHKVVEFGLSLPPTFKFKKGQNKILLREIAMELVPERLINRPKKGFGIPQARWIREELFELTREILKSSEFKSRGWFNSKKVEQLLNEHKNGINHDNVIWPIIVLELWARNWLDD